MQQIIVYRNPAEAAFWEFASSANFFIMLVWVFVFFVVFLSLHSLLSRFVGNFGRKAAIATNFSLGVGAIAATAFTYFLL